MSNQLRTPWTMDSSDGEVLVYLLVDFAESRGIIVDLEADLSDKLGVSKGSLVEVQAGLSSADTARVLAHELAHELLHRNGRGSLNPGMQEREAESVACVVCRHFRLDGLSRLSFAAIWGGYGAPLLSSMERIAGAAKSIIEEVEGE